MQRLQRRPKVTVAVPNYNYAHFLPDTIGSVLDQSDVEVEVFVIDNASTDDSVSVIQDMARNDRRITLLRHEKNLGQMPSFNEGARAGTGEYLVMLCADDMLTPGSLARAAALLDACPSVGLVYGYPTTFTSYPPNVSTTASGWSVWPGRRWFQERFHDGRNVISSPEVMMRRSVMDQLSYDERIPERADLVLWLRAALRSDVGRVQGASQAYHRIHDGRASVVEYSGLMLDFRARLRAFGMVLDDDAELLPGDAARLRRNLERALAREAFRLARRCLDTGEPIGGSGADDYLRFAAETFPPITATRGWRSVRRPRPYLRRRGAQQVYRVRHHVQWRLWRRYGV
ncbi:MAG TPA: glycosyltransferase family A protein [Mycobacteriales bacterium]|nr:glycosyltransferase family A protein [Mycobacteriales bacterium]